MPVFLTRVTVTHNVADNLGIYLCSSVKAEGSLDSVILEVAVDSLRAADYLYASTDRSIVFCEYASVGVRVVTTDDYESLDVESLKDFETFVKLILLLQLSTARADDVETTSVTVFVNDFCGELHVVVLYETARTENETIKLVFRI